MKKLYYFFILCFLACKPELNEKGNVTLNNLQSQDVKLIGTSYEKGFNKSINFYRESYFYGGIHKLQKKEFNGDLIRIVLGKIEKPELFEIMAFGENTFYSTRIIVSPGDSLRYTLKEGKLKFLGKNQEHYNFYLEMDPEVDDWGQIYLNKYNPDFKKYKAQCDSLYNKRLIFFNNYIEKHPTVSSAFKKKIRDELRFEYLVNIIKPRSEIQGKFIVNTQEDLFSIYQRRDKQEGEFFDINGYLNNITLEEVNKPEYVNNLYFKMSIVPLIRQHFVKSSEIPYSKQSFIQELAFIEKSFDQVIVKYATGRLIVDYYEKGLGKDENSTDFMKKTIIDYKKKIKDSTYFEAISDIEQELSSINKVVPKELNEFVHNLSKDSIKLNYILQKKKIKVIDFWASWCQPCIKEIIVSKHERKKLIDKYNLEFIYLSIDSDPEKWIEKSVNLYDYLPGSNQFRIINVKKSNLIKFLNIKASYGITIPRYIVLDQNNRIIDNNAPKPSDNKFEEVISNLNGNGF
jgi:thiol-disulfide isomerase/thioredoxin